MAQRLVLLFSQESRTLYRWQRNRLDLEQRFSPESAGLEELRQTLRRCRGALLHVVLDLAGEDFHEEHIPLLRGTERRIVIERRLAQRYRDASLAAGISLGSKSAERRNERLLLSSIAQTGAFAEWLEALQQAPVTLVSAVSTAMIAPAIAAGLKLGENLLLASVNGAGLRQTLLENGRLRLSRLEQAPPDALSPAFVQREVERTLKFLEDLRGPSGDRPPIPVVLLVPEAERQRFEAGDQAVAFRVVGVAEAAKRLGFRLPPDAGADSLYVHMAALRPPAEQFLRGAARRPFLAWRLRRATLAIGASALTGCAAYAGLLWLEAKETRAAMATLRQQIVQLRAEEQRQRSGLPIAPANAELVKTTAMEFRRIVARSAAPQAAWIHLSKALDASPDIELDALAWEITDASVQALEVSARARSATQADHREIGKQVEHFSNLLASGGWRVFSTRMPFDAAPQNPLAGDFGARELSERSRFSVTLSGPLR